MNDNKEEIQKKILLELEESLDEISFGSIEKCRKNNLSGRDTYSVLIILVSAILVNQSHSLYFTARDFSEFLQDIVKNSCEIYKKIPAQDKKKVN